MYVCVTVSVVSSPVACKNLVEICQVSFPCYSATSSATFTFSVLHLRRDNASDAFFFHCFISLLLLPRMNGYAHINSILLYYFTMFPRTFFLLIYKRKVQWHVSVFLVVNTSFFLTVGWRERRGANKHVFVLLRFSFGGGMVGWCNGDLCISRENCSRKKTIVTIHHLQFLGPQA